MADNIDRADCPIEGCKSKMLKDINSHLYRRHKDLDLTLEDRKALTSKAFSKSKDVECSKEVEKTDQPEDLLEYWTKLLKLERPNLEEQGANRLSLSEQETKRISLTEQEAKSLNLAEQDAKGVSLEDQEAKRLNLAEQDAKGVSLEDQEAKRLNLAGQDAKGVSLEDQEAIVTSLREDLALSDDSDDDVQDSDEETTQHVSSNNLEVMEGTMSIVSSIQRRDENVANSYSDRAGESVGVVQNVGQGEELVAPSSSTHVMARLPSPLKRALSSDDHSLGQAKRRHLSLSSTNWQWISLEMSSLLEDPEKYLKHQSEEAGKLTDTRHNILGCPIVDHLINEIHAIVVGRRSTIPLLQEMTRLGEMISGAIEIVVDQLETKPGQKVTMLLLERTLMLLCKSLRKIRHILRLLCMQQLKFKLPQDVEYVEDSENVFGKTVAQLTLKKICQGYRFKKLSKVKKKTLLEACNKASPHDRSIQQTMYRQWEGKAREWVFFGVREMEWNSVCQKTDYLLEKCPIPSMLVGVFHNVRGTNIKSNMKNLLHLITHTSNTLKALQKM